MICVRHASLALLLFVFVLPVQAAWISPFISEIHYDNVGADVNELIAVTGPSELDLSGWSIVLYNGTDGQPYRTLALSGSLGDDESAWAERFWPIARIQNGPDAVALLSSADRLIDFVAYEASVVASAGMAAGATARLLPASEGTGTAAASSLQRSGIADEWIWKPGRATPGILNPGLLGFEVGRVPVTDTSRLWLVGVCAWLLWYGVGRARRCVVTLQPLRCRLERRDK